MECSLEFVKNRIENGDTNLNISDYDSLYQVNLLEILKNTNNDNIAKYLSEGVRATKGDLEYTIKYEPNCDYEYFTMSRCNCDGTLMFYNDLCYKALNKVLNAETCKDGVMTYKIYNKIEDYTIEYIIGDFVFGDEYDELKFKTEEKPWMYSRFTVMLPIKFELKLKENKIMNEGMVK